MKCRIPMDGFIKGGFPNQEEATMGALGSVSNMD